MRLDIKQISLSFILAFLNTKMSLGKGILVGSIPVAPKTVISLAGEDIVEKENVGFAACLFDDGGKWVCNDSTKYQGWNHFARIAGFCPFLQPNILMGGNPRHLRPCAALRVSPKMCNAEYYQLRSCVFVSSFFFSLKVE